MSRLQRHEEPPPETIVDAVVSPNGGVELLHATLLPGGEEYAYQRIATDGSRTPSHHAGTYPVAWWLPHAERLRRVACGPQPPWQPAHKVAAARDLLRASKAWEGKAAGALADLCDACGAYTVAMAGIGQDATFLKPVDARYGRRAVEAALARLPALASPMERVLRKGSTAEQEALDRILGGEPDLDALVADLSFILDHEIARSSLSSLSSLSSPPRSVDDPSRGIVSRAGGSLKRLVRNLEGVHVAPGNAIGCLMSCRLAPRDWMPSDPVSLRAMELVLVAAEFLADRSGGVLRVADLIAPLRGDWIGALALPGESAPAAEGLLLGREPSRISNLHSEAADMAQAYRNQVLGPALSHARMCAGLPSAILPEERAHLDREAWRELFGRKGLPAIMALVADWHALAPTRNGMIRQLAGRFTPSWRRPFEDFAASDGRRVVPLLDADALVEEGIAMRHCIGGYADGCISGRYAVASVRAPHGGRSSTVQIGKRGVIEHKAACNADPCPEDVAAVAELLAAMPARRAVRRSPLRLAQVAYVRAAGRWIDLASPAWAKDHPYNPACAAHVLVAASLWARHVRRGARGSIAAILAVPAPAASAAMRDRPSRRLLRPLEPLRRAGTLTATALSRAIRHKLSESVCFALACAFIAAVGWTIFDARRESMIAHARQESGLSGTGQQTQESGHVVGREPRPVLAP